MATTFIFIWACAYCVCYMYNKPWRPDGGTHSSPTSGKRYVAHLGAGAVGGGLALEQHVACGEVAVHDAVRVHVRHALRHLHGRAQDAVQPRLPIRPVIRPRHHRHPQRACAPLFEFWLFQGDMHS